MRISSVFFAVLDLDAGPKLLYQVPEGLISSTSSSRSKSGVSPPKAQAWDKQSHGYPVSSLFEFDVISRFVIPHQEMCGRLTICTTRKYRILGFPTVLRSPIYKRDMFQYNVCFAFSREMDVSSYEPIIRKVGRVLATCEKNRQLLSSPESSYRIYQLLEQLFADLNSFSETSIQLDDFNSLELKIFPHYPNPPNVDAWDVPVPLINIKDRTRENWDLTMKTVVPLINGVNHVQKIALVAKADISLVKECLSQLLMYQCIMMIDIFQFSNLYALCRPVAWLFADPAVSEECGAYIRKDPTKPQWPWPKLAWLYARIKPPLTVGTWISEYDVDVDQIDVRRFVSFGVIKGFLRRVHRWPILLEGETQRVPLSRRRGKTLVLSRKITSGVDDAISMDLPSPPLEPPQLMSAIASPSSRRVSGIGGDTRTRKIRHLLIQTRKNPTDLTSPEFVNRGSMNGIGPKTGSNDGPPSSVNLLDKTFQRLKRGDSDLATGPMSTSDDSPGSTHVIKLNTTDMTTTIDSSEQTLSSDLILQPMFSFVHRAATDLPPDLSKMLDGTHHTDELCVQLGFAWNVLEQVLATVGGATDEGQGGSLGDLGRVVILYR